MAARAIDEDFVLDWTRSLGPLAALYRGRDGLTEFVREQWEVFESFEMRPSEFIDRGRHVVVPNTVHAQGRGASRSQQRRTTSLRWGPTDGCLG